MNVRCVYQLGMWEALRLFVILHHEFNSYLMHFNVANVSQIDYETFQLISASGNIADVTYF